MKRLALVLAISLSACTHPVVVTKLETVTPKIPPDMLTCEKAPDSDNITTDGEFATWSIGVWAAWQDCYNHVVALNASLGK